MDNNLDDDVKSLLAILQPETAKKEEKKAEKTEKKASEPKAAKEPKEEKSEPAIKREKPAKAVASFLGDINEPSDKTIYNSKVLIREEIYEVFMSLKRTKKMKSVSTLIDFALEDYIKRNKEEIKNLIYSNQNKGIL